MNYAGIEQMAVKLGFGRSVLIVTLFLGLGSAYAQDELRKTFFKDADAAKAAADAAVLIKPLRLTFMPFDFQ